MTALLVAEALCKSYSNRSSRSGFGLQDVSFEIGVGECLGLVGESGCGKSTLARLLLAIERPDSGDVRLDGVSLARARGKELRTLRRSIQIVFQDSTSALNDRLPVWRSVIEPLDNYPDASPPVPEEPGRTRRVTAWRLLELVGLGKEQLDKYPHQLSGGQKQRVAIARGIALRPRLLVCDEPTSSLDAVIQAQILQLLKRLQTELGMSYLFISHDIAAVHRMSDRILVLQNGRAVDRFAAGDIWSSDRHSYTKLLASAAQ